MANNVPITAGSGTPIAADDISSVWYQRVKLVDGTEDSTTAIPGDANGLFVKARQVGTMAFIQPAATTTAATPFAVGDVVGTEISFTNAVLASGGFGVVEGATIVSDSATTPMGAMDLYLFTSASTPAADNAANSWSDANMLLCRGIVRFPAPDISALNTIAHWTGAIPFNCAATTLFGVMVTRAVWTPVATAAPIVGLHIRQYAA